MTRRPTLSRREQRRFDRQVREHFAKNPTELSPELSNLLYSFVMAWQPEDDDENELWRTQVSGLLDACMDWAYERGKEQASARASWPLT